ncbi:hypothetical protein [Portibacter marinus]|uniref:hypothetical protein n=1 Tax=Portibacter marinus TaxID=2898660 RepID=UPI001F2A6FE1|nr:hypothetical protein [Portibacter marinus]
MSEPTSDKRSVFKKWLETLQQESWQLELLISGLALLGVFNAKVFIDGLESYFAVQFLRGAAVFGVEIFMFLLKGSWYIFLINLMIHIILRGLWIGAIGLRYVSEDIDYQKLNFSNYFTKLYTRKYQSFDDYIEDLERICSVIFAYTFLLFFILISACLFLIWPILLYAVIDELLATFIVMAYLIIGLIVFVDFIFLNPLKKIKEEWFGRVYGFVFRFYSTITLSFIFRPLLLNFLDNKFTKRLFLFSIPYGIVIILLLPNLTSRSAGYFPSFESNSLQIRAYNSNALNPHLYDDLRLDGKQKVNYISLDKYRISGNVLEFFVTHMKSDEYYFKQVKDIQPLNKVGVYTGFKSMTIKDSIFQQLSEQNVQERVAFLSEKRENRSERSNYEWDSLYNVLENNHQSIERAYHADKMLELNAAFESLCKFYIDDQEITDHVECLMTQHGNLGEKGWKCITVLDSLQSGLHRLKVERGIYRRNLNVISPVVLEIPFILD